VTRGKSGYVTGGTSGIGKSLVKNLLGRGYSVAYTGTSQRTVDAVMAELKQSAVSPAQKIEGIVLDVDNSNKTLAVLENLIATRDLRIVVSERIPLELIATASSNDHLTNKRLTADLLRIP